MERALFSPALLAAYAATTEARAQRSAPPQVLPTTRQAALAVPVVPSHRPRRTSRARHPGRGRCLLTRALWAVACLAAMGVAARGVDLAWATTTRPHPGATSTPARANVPRTPTGLPTFGSHRPLAPPAPTSSAMSPTASPPAAPADANTPAGDSPGSAVDSG